jgi:hypothetical protein
MQKRFTPSRLVLAAAATLAAAAPATAGIVPVQVTIDQQADHTRYTYRVKFPGELHINPGDSFTIYDFAGFNGTAGATTLGGADLTNWTLSTSDTGPSYDNIAPSADAADIPNLTWTFTGATPLFSSTDFVIGLFFAETDRVGADTIKVGDFSSVAHRDTDDVEVNSNTKVAVPQGDNVIDPPPGGNQTPEPATLALLGLGLPLAGAFKSWKKRQAV